MARLLADVKTGAWWRGQLQVELEQMESVEASMAGHCVAAALWGLW